MSYRLQFKQEFKAENKDEFLKLEREFVRLEQETPGFPRGRRLIPVSGPDCTNLLVWECDFPDTKSLYAALDRMGNDPEHERLYSAQKQYIVRAHTGIYEDFGLEDDHL